MNRALPISGSQRAALGQLKAPPVDNAEHQLQVYPMRVLALLEV